jgi:BolA family transcriptional regulator, general stress-responsive regulator
MTPDTNLGPVGQTISAKLRQNFSPAALDVIDESHQHIGHSGARPDGESHFRVRIVAEVFRGKSRVEQHRMVNVALAHELVERVHALAIETAVPAATPQLSFEVLQAEDPRLAELLNRAGLPADDLAGKVFLGIVDGGNVVACGGIEKRGDCALLRSIAVAPEQRKGGLGSAITLKLLAEARNDGAHAAYLLTSSAIGFFEGLGFSRIERAKVPAPIQATGQFSGTTCSSAQPMVQVLKPV